ncbi:MAG TPA: HDOD domain-containing protein, partial [Rhodocyclaceae bacterium]|nr:HDOD domain-containing protein [Rhodocyclaceae bacterium]
MPIQLTQEEIISRAELLPAFPRVVTDILATLDDENATIGMLAQHVERDPVITARMLSLANGVANGRQGTAVRDVATAASMVGIARLKELVVSLSLAHFAKA